MQETKAELANRHLQEWQHFTQEIYEPYLGAFDEKEMKTVKAVADTLRIKQAGERAAFDYASSDLPANTNYVFAWEEESEV